MLKCTQLDERKGQQRAFSGGLTLEQKGSCRRRSALSLLCQIYLNQPSPDESVKAHSSSCGVTLTASLNSLRRILLICSRLTRVHSPAPEDACFLLILSMKTDLNDEIPAWRSQLRLRAYYETGLLWEVSREID